MNGNKIQIRDKRFGGDYSVETIKKIIQAAKEFNVSPYVALGIAMQESNLGQTRPDYGVNLVGGLDPEQQDRVASIKDELTRINKQLKSRFGSKVKSKKLFKESWDFLEKKYENEKKNNEDRKEYIKKQLRIPGPNDVWRESLISENLRTINLARRKKEAQADIDFLNRIGENPKLNDLFIKKFSLEDDIQKISEEVESSPERRLAKVIKYKIEYGKKLGKNTDAELIQAFNGYGRIRTYQDGHIQTERMPKLYGQKSSIIDFNKTPLYGERILELVDVFRNNSKIRELVGE